MAKAPKKIPVKIEPEDLPGPLTVVALRVTNYMRVRHVEIRPRANQHLVKVSGGNANGKSSTLGALAALLGGERNAAEVPVHRGADGAEIYCLFGKEGEPILEVKVKYDAEGKRIGVGIRSSLGELKSQQSVLDLLANRSCLDPSLFFFADGRKQLELLKQSAGIDWTEIDERRQRLYEQRTIANRELKLAQGKIDETPFLHSTYPLEKMSLVQLTARNVEATDRREKRAALLRARDSEAQNVEGIKADIQKLTERLAELNAELLAAESMLESAQKAVDQGPKEEDTTDIVAKIREAEQHNERADMRQAYDTAVEERDQFKEEYERLDREIDEIDRLKQEELAGKWPIHGLSVTEDAILMNGLPLSQASHAEQVNLAMSIEAMKKPKVQIILLRDASRCDGRFLKEIYRIAKEKGYQVWAELVGIHEDGVVIEDGGVVDPNDHELIAQLKEKYTLDVDFEEVEEAGTLGATDTDG
jgi:hypothetical protein